MSNGKLRAIRRIQGIKDANLALILSQMKENIDILTGQAGNTKIDYGTIGGTVTTPVDLETLGSGATDNAGVVYPETYGAKGDGVTDDTAAINAWLACGAKHLHAPAGTYLNTGDFTIPSSTLLTGDGIGITVFKLKANISAGTVATVNMFSTADSGSDITVTDLTIDGNRDNQSWTPGGSANYGLAIRSSNTWISRVETREVTANGMGCPVNATGVTILGCSSHDNGKKGFHSGDVTHITIMGNSFYDNETDAGIGMHQGLTEGVVSGNRIWGNLYGIYVGSSTGAYNASRHLSITGNLIEDNSTVGLFFVNNSTSDAVYDLNCEIIGNTFIKNAHGMQITKGYGAIVKGNTFKESGTYGLWLNTDTQRCIVEGNIFVNNGQSDDTKAAIALTSAATVTGNIIKNNHIYDSQATVTQKTGISVGADSVLNVIEGNHIENADSCAINDTSPFGANIIRNNLRLGTSGEAKNNVFSGTPVVRSVKTVSTTGTGEDDLITATVLAGMMDKGNGVKFTAWGKNTGTGGNKTVKLYFGATAFTAIPADNNANEWSIEAIIYNTSTGAQRGWIKGWRGTTLVYSDYITATIDTISAVAVKLTGECADGGDTISQYGFIGEYL